MLEYNPPMTPQDATAQPAPAGMSDLSRIVGVLFEPSKTFADIARRPSWIVPLVLGIVAAMALTAFYGQHIGWDRIVRRQVESSSQAQQIPADQKEQRIAAGARIAPMIGYAAPVIIGPLYALLVAGIFTGLVAGIMSAPVKFKQAFAVVTWAGIPNLIVVVLSAVVVFLKNPDEVDIQNPLMFNVGSYMDAEHGSKFLHSMATSIDLFSFWVIFLMATGLKAAGGKKLSFGGALFVVLLPWATYVLIKSALSGVFG
jgi:Yip1 domain